MLFPKVVVLLVLVVEVFVVVLTTIETPAKVVKWSASQAKTVSVVFAVLRETPVVSQEFDVAFQ